MCMDLIRPLNHSFASLLPDEALIPRPLSPAFPSPGGCLAVSSEGNSKSVRKVRPG